jgi:DNA polymerase-3 subunit gamma/tau
MLSTAAFNAMLKVLEEPPSHVIFILATTEVHKVPQTIISRCQRFDFHKIPADAIRQRLRTIAEAEGVTVADPVLAAIAEHAEGSLRDAESTLGQVLALGGKRISLDEASLVIPRSNLKDAAALVGHILARDASSALTLVNTLVEQGVAVPVFMADVIVWLRNMLLAKVGQRLDLFSQATLGELQGLLLKQVADVSVGRLQHLIDVFLRRRQRLGESPLPHLPLELAIVESCLGESSADSAGAAEEASPS